MATGAPDIRVTTRNDAALREDGAFVLYWMIANRRPVWNFALDHAEARAAALEKPLVVLEALRVGYPWASDRLHAFIIDGMADNAAAFENNPLRYYPYVERESDAGKGLLAALAEKACCVVTDEAPYFFYPQMLEAAANQIDVQMETVDASGLIPLRGPDKTFARAYDFRRWIHQQGVDGLLDRPRKQRAARDRLPTLERLPRAITDRWPPLTDAERDDREWLADLPIDHEVGVADGLSGGRTAARRRLRAFIEDGLPRYAEDGNHPDSGATSGLSPYLHFGHIAPHEVFEAVADAEGWTPARISEDLGDGRRAGWWGMSESAEAFLDQLVTWRELGYNTAFRDDDYDDYGGLPEWARETLGEHASDRREHVYDLDAFAASETHDEIWNAAQTELRETGRLHNYMRMLWGKKILEWTSDPETALEVMIELNNRYAVDGRDPNSYSGITWCLGRYDRAWGPEREIFGKIRYMSSDSTRRKLRLSDYLEKFGSDA